MTKKIYVLDTSVLIHDPNSYTNFAGNDVVIPINVLDELDKLKTFPNEAGKNARVCVRKLDALCKKGDIHKGIKLENDITLKIDTSKTTDQFGSHTYADNAILACAYEINKKQIKKKVKFPVILVSKDINLRIRARAFDLHAEDYEKDRVDVNELYSGFIAIQNQELGVALKSRSIDCRSYDELKNLYPNQCVQFLNDKSNSISLGRKVGDYLIHLKGIKPWGLDTRNMEQAFAVDLLCDPNIPLVSLIGPAGTGKSLITIAAALELVKEKHLYQKMIVYRPIQTVEKDIGYLPGTVEEKLYPYMQAIYDAFEFLLCSRKGDRENWKQMFELWQQKEIIQLDAITYVRGRSLPDCLIIVDEAQNLSKEEIKTLLTRASSGTKVILTGDIDQIDNNSLDATNNGLSYVVEAFKKSQLAGHITLTKGERSELATEASRLL
jgi:PhoH-like ATPase